MTALDRKDILKANYQQILFVFIAFLAMVLVSYFYVSGIVRNQMLIIGEASMDSAQTSISASLTETELWFANTAQGVESLLSSGRNNAELLTFLRDTNAYFTDRSPMADFMKIYGYIRGEFLDGSGWVPPPGYEPATRPWYTGAENNGGRIYFSEPYIDAETGGFCISFSQQVVDASGAPQGILAADLKLSRIADHVRHQKIAGNGYGVLIDDKQTFIAHGDARLIGTGMVAAGGDYPRLARMFAEGEPISAVRFRDADGTDSVVFFRTVFNGWHIGVIIPRSTYYERVHSLGEVLGAMGLVLMLALSAMLVRTRVEKMRSEAESLSKSNFLARMSHEMRTPMNAIIGMTNIAKTSADPDKKEYCLNRIGEASNHLLGVINDVLDMSKIEAGKLELSETDFSFAGLLRQVETVVNYKIEEKRQTFTVEVGKDVPAALMSDKQRLAQVITNLISNANKFTPEGGRIVLRVRRLQDDGREGWRTLRFEVEDNGIGIAKEHQGRLFHSFEQADGSIARKYGGTGLGLAISKRIIDLMGGTIWVESEPGKGSRFLFTIRVKEGSVPEIPGTPEVAPEASPEQAGEPGGPAPENAALSQTGPAAPVFAGKRILLAEDVDINREILIALLEDTGVTIDSAENGRKACEAFAANPDAYDLIFMDIHMPEMDGYEAARQIRAMPVPTARSVPILAMTANVFREDIEKCLAVGMNDHIAKPLELTELLAKMKIWLGKKAA